jgi:bifunctional non-homologous end joining protein LigD
MTGFRALAYVLGGKPRLVSRNGRDFKRFDDLRDELELEVNADAAVIDGEICCLDESGRPLFFDLMRRRGRPVFVSFDLLWLNGRDVRELTLTKRKTLVRAIVPERSPSILYAHHVKRDGRALFETICQHDLEGIVAKLARGRYDVAAPTWIKVQNATYSQREGRHELFERRA